MFSQKFSRSQAYLLIILVSILGGLLASSLSLRFYRERLVPLYYNFGKIAYFVDTVFFIWFATESFSRELGKINSQVFFAFSVL